MNNKRLRIGALFFMMVLMSIALVTTVSASQESMDKWMKDHTVSVRSTITYKYDGEFLEIKEVYSGKDLKKQIGVSKLAKEHKIPIEVGELSMNNGKVVSTGGELVVSIENAEIFRIKKGEEKAYVAQKNVVLTGQKDPYQWEASYDYPQWTWSKILWWYEMEDPINMAWEKTNLEAVKSEILYEGWTDYPWEEVQYVHDPVKGWVVADGMADDRYRLFGGYHTRMWQMSDGDVVANAHHDDSFFSIWGHQVDQYEEAEYLVSDFYGKGWKVRLDDYWLDNYFTNVYGALNNGEVTRIY